MENVIDSHQHFWQVDRFDYPWMSREVEVLCQDYLPLQLEPILKRCEVEKTILIQASNSLAETRWLLELADEHPFIAGVVGWVDLTAPDLAVQLKQFKSHPKFKGVRHLVESEPQDDWLTQPRVLDGLRALAGRGLTFDLLVHTRHLKYAKIAVESCPELRFVIDHMAKPAIARGELGRWTREIKQLAAFENVWCKLSGLVTEANWTNWKTEDLKPFIESAIEYFGPRRIMFGSDWPVCLLASSYDRVLQAFQMLLAELSDEDRERIFSKNAMDFYGTGRNRSSVSEARA
jgi:L-fuconolactonase